MKVGFAFYYKRKNNSSGNLNKGKKYFTLRTDTRIQNYKCFDSSPAPISPKSRDGKETAEANKQFCKTKT